MRTWPRGGFTLIELLIAVAILGVLAAMAAGRYEAYIERVRVTRATLDIEAISAEIDGQTAEGAAPPASLAVIGLPPNDPWGFPYRYLPLRDATGQRINIGRARKDRFLVPLNDDYDLFSIGRDGRTNVRIVHAASRDDVVRANNGAFVGRADQY